MNRKIQIGNFFEKDSFPCSIVRMPLVFFAAGAESLRNAKAINNSDSFSRATKGLFVRTSQQGVSIAMVSHL